MKKRIILIKDRIKRLKLLADKKRALYLPGILDLVDLAMEIIIDPNPDSTADETLLKCFKRIDYLIKKYEEAT